MTCRLRKWTFVSSESAPTRASYSSSSVFLSTWTATKPGRSEAAYESVELAEILVRRDDVGDAHDDPRTPRLPLERLRCGRATAGVGSEVAGVEPNELIPVTSTLILNPTSVDVGTYVLAVAPEIAQHSSRRICAPKPPVDERDRARSRPAALVRRQRPPHARFAGDGGPCVVSRWPVERSREGRRRVGGDVVRLRSPV